MLTSCSGQDHSRPRLPIYTSPHTLLQLFCRTKTERRILILFTKTTLALASLYICPHTPLPPAFCRTKTGRRIFILFNKTTLVLASLYIRPHTPPPPALLSNKDGAQDIYIIHHDHSRPRLPIYMSQYTSSSSSFVEQRRCAGYLYYSPITYTSIYPYIPPATPAVYANRIT